MKTNNLISAWIAAVLLLLSGTIIAQVPDQNTPPDALIKMVVTDVMASVKADPEIQKGNIPKVMELVKRKLFHLPICAVRLKWQWALIGRKPVLSSRLF